MVRDKNLSTFAKLISIEHYLMKQMNLKYFYRSFGILLWILILASCVKSDPIYIDPIKDAQIYSFSVTSKVDSNKYFNDIKFSIDQVNGRIFNQDSLPYLFDVDSIFLHIKGNPSAGYSNVEIELVNTDSTYSWNAKDSIDMHRLKTIEITAQDGDTKRKYDISINIHQQDPYIFNWDNIISDDNPYINPSIIDIQRTISYKDQFITYYKVNGEVRASSASAFQGNDWKDKMVAGLTGDINLSSMHVSNNSDISTLYCLNYDGDVFATDDGYTWNNVNSAYSVKAIYGDLPHLEGEYRMLLAAESDGKLYFATSPDFITFDIKNELVKSIPVRDFSSVSINDPKVYTAKAIIIYGGNDIDGNSNKKIWIVNENNDIIEHISKMSSVNIDNAQMFFYDNMPYMFVAEENEGKYENKFYFSEDRGATWKWGGSSQSVEEEMLYRNSTSVISDSNNFIWIFGGKSKFDKQIVDVWRGRLNKLAK